MLIRPFFIKNVYLPFSPDKPINIMCGIAGIISDDIARLKFINLMTSKLHHRGPDNQSN